MQANNFKGLDEESVIQNRKLYGENSLKDEGNSTLLVAIKNIIFEPLFIILFCTSLVYFLLKEYGEGIIMLIALSFVSGISMYQENKSRIAVDTLKKLSSPIAKVMRGGIAIEIPTIEIVLNDIIVVEDGMIVPADAIVLEAHDFSVNESILTGESLPVFKSSDE